MNENYFIESLYPQFSPGNWQSGVTIFRSGDVVHFQFFSDLLSARIKISSREFYEVRFKLNAEQSYIQWMECSCQANRRHSEKCAHIAAFSIYIDLEGYKKLNLKMNFGKAQDYFYLPREEYSSQNKNEKLITHKKSIVEKKELKLQNINPSEIQSIGLSAHRYFSIKKNSTHSLFIRKRIKIIQNEKNVIFDSAVSELNPDKIGSDVLFIDNFGYIPFKDKMSQNQILKWSDYPSDVSIDNDTTAILIESKFERLKETAEVEIDPLINKIQIFNKMSISDVDFNLDSDGLLYLDTKISIQNENTPWFSIQDVLLSRKQGHKYLKTEDGFTKITKDFDWVLDNIQKDGKIKLNKLDFIKFHELLGKDAKFNGNSDVISKMRQGLVSRKDLPEPIINNTELNLRPYQMDGLKWLWWLYNNQFGGLLADEMGLGKTHQTMGLIAAISNTKKNGRYLVVCPTSVIDHWMNKLSLNLKNISLINYHSPIRKKFLNALVDASIDHLVFVTSYGILLRDAVILKEINWDLIVLDEAHIVKNQTTRTYKAALKIPSRMRLCLTGTPLENDLLELKNLYDYIVPGYLGSDSEFKKKYILKDKIQEDPLNTIELHRLIHPFKLRRHKNEVLKDLPTKVEDFRYCHLNSFQRKIYNEIINLRGSEIINNLSNNEIQIPYIHIFSIITLLKQVCDDPALINPKYENYGSGKLNVLDELLQEALESNFKVVIFSQYAKMIARLSTHLKNKNISHVTLTGQSTNRGEIIRKFQEDPEIHVFLGSLLAGGTGIDLTSANIVIHYDRWWNAAKENQATDRVHRIGQTKNVQVYKLITKGTLEEKINEIILRKKSIFDKFIEKDEAIFRHLTREDLLTLLTKSENDDASYFNIDENDEYLEKEN